MAKRFFFLVVVNTVRRSRSHVPCSPALSPARSIFSPHPLPTSLRHPPPGRTSFHFARTTRPPPRQPEREREMERLLQLRSPRFPSSREFLRVPRKRLHLPRCLVSGVTSFSRVSGEVARPTRTPTTPIHAGSSLGQGLRLGARLLTLPFRPTALPRDRRGEGLG